MADRLRRVRSQLVERCNKALLKKLLDDLLDSEILNEGEKEYIEQSFNVRADIVRELIDTVIKKGDKSCNILLQKITERDQALSSDLGITELPLPTQEQNPHSTQPFQPSNANLKSSEINGITLCTETEYQNIWKEKDIYPIKKKHERKRWALIICNIRFEKLKERQGANIDIVGMKALLEGLDYKVRCETDLTAEEMKTTLRTFANNSDHKDSDSTFLVFMSHGERDVICGTDFKKEDVQGKEIVTGFLHVDDIFEAFNNVNCKQLREKPKMIIIQACRGNEKGEKWVSDSTPEPPDFKQEDLEEDVMHKILKEQDLICFYSTTPDTVSFRCTITGSPFIQRLIAVIQKDAHNLSVEDIFRKVQLTFKNEAQMPSRDRNTLLKKFYLFPGF